MKRPIVLFFKSRSLIAKNTTPPLGLLYVAAYLRKKLKADVKIIDAMFKKDPVNSVLKTIRTYSPNALGISALTAEAFLAHKVAAAVKNEFPDLPIIFGGPHPSSNPELVMEDENIDASVIGEGEETFCEVIRVISEEGPYWKTPKTLSKIDGLVFRGEGLEFSKPRAPISDLDALPFPAWDLIDYKKFWTRGSMASVGIRPYLTMFTSRGCPYHCVFCHQLFGKVFRSRSPENVIDEVKQILKMGAGHIEILDDISNLDHNRFNGILELMLKDNLHPVLSFPNAIRADIMREDSIDLLKKVGVGEVSVAVETASKRLQKLICKNLDLDKTRRVIEMLAKRRIFTRGFFIMGFPTETEEEMRSTIRFAHKSPLHLALFFTPNPFRNTKLFDMFKKAGKLPENSNSIDFEYYDSAFNASEVSTNRSRFLYRWAYYGFYFNPIRAYRIARDGPFRLDIPVRAYYLFRNVVEFRRLRENFDE
ncbi:MAG: B12-binding domain-containing radical SAM protein [Elusimicrobia bacterium]|nr:B12-binding domain-containing radical SAM protein [Elusimicrobiota bacterium]